MFGKYKWVVIGVAVVVVVGLVAVSRLVRTRKTEKFDVALGSEKAEVLVTNSRRMIPLLGSGARYEVAVKRASGKATDFIVKDQPRGLWLLGGKLYVATYGSMWQFAVVGEQGRTRRVSRANLPAGPRPANLTDDPAKWEQMMATMKPAKKTAARPVKKTTQPAKPARRGAGTAKAK